MNTYRQIQVRQEQGFTLIEVMVAMLIMAVLSVLAYNGFDGILQMESRSKEEFLEENRRSLSSSIILNDFLHLRARPVRDQLGGVKGAYMVPSGEYAVEFTRGGLPDVPSMNGGIQRVAYRVENDRLIRTTWESADLGPATKNYDQILASGVESIKVEQLDSQNDYVPNWPPLNENLRLQALPAMIRVTLGLAGGEEMELLVPGTNSVSTADAEDD